MVLPTFCRSTENEGQQSSLDNVSTYPRVSFTSFTWIRCSNQPPNPFCCRKIRAQALLQGNMGGCTPYAFHMNTPKKLMLWENYFLLNTWPWVWRKFKRQLFKAPFFFVFGFSPQYFPTSQGSLHYHPKQYIKKTWKLEIPRNYHSDLECFIFPPQKNWGNIYPLKKTRWQNMSATTKAWSTRINGYIFQLRSLFDWDGCYLGSFSRLSHLVVGRTQPSWRRIWRIWRGYKHALCVKKDCVPRCVQIFHLGK